MNKISIITVTRNRPQLLKNKALASLLGQTSLDFEARKCRGNLGISTRLLNGL